MPQNKNILYRNPIDLNKNILAKKHHSFLQKITKYCITSNCTDT